MMEFDIRTIDTAYGFLLKFLQMRPDELIIEHLVNCERDYEQFWNRNFSKINGSMKKLVCLRRRFCRGGY